MSNPRDIILSTQWNEIVFREVVGTSTSHLKDAIERQKNSRIHWYFNERSSQKVRAKAAQAPDFQ